MLLAVARAGSILKAASEVGLTQPALSKCIAELERAFGARLFDRTNRGVVKTPYGEILLRRATGMFEELRHAADEIDALNDGTRGELRIGATPTMCAGALPRAIEAVLAQRPNYRFQVSEAPLESLADEVLGRSLDLAIGRGPRIRADLAFDRLFDDRLFVIAGASHPLAGRRSVTLADAARYPWLLPAADSSLIDQVQAEFRKHGLEPPRAAVAAMSVSLRYELVAANRLVTAMYGSVLRLGTIPAFVRVLPIDLPVSIPVGILRHRRRTLGASASFFMDAMRRVASTMQSLDARQLKLMLRQRIEAGASERRRA